MGPVEQAKERDEEKPRATAEPLAAVAPRDDVRVASSRARCPFCHADVDADAADWVACKGCLARHHLPCWGESGACATCGEHRFLPATTGRRGERAGANDAPKRRTQTGRVVAAVVAMAIGIGVSIAVVASSPSSLRPRSTPSVSRNFTKAETRSYELSRPSGRSVTGSWGWYLDEYADAIAKRVLEGYTVPKSPDREFVIALLEHVAKVYREDGRETDAWQLDQALKAIKGAK